MVISSSPLASDKCHQEKRKTVTGEDVLFSMTLLGFENYAEVMKIYFTKYREVSHLYRYIHPFPCLAAPRVEVEVDLG